MKYFSMFSGIGGFEHGINKCISNKQLAEIEQNRQRRNGIIDEVEHNVLPTSRTAPLCVGYSEIDKYAVQIYNKQFKGHKNYGNCREIEWKDVPDFEMLVGGFPCQAFSIAGKRGGFEDTRGTLFFEIARCLEPKQPRLFVLENVKGLLSHDKGNTFFTIITTLDNLGYDCQWQVLNSKNFGVPQNRERVFIVGHLRGTSRPEVFPIEKRSKGIIESVPQQKPQAHISQTIDTITGSYPKFGQYIAPVLTPDRAEKRQNGRRFKENGDPSFTLTAQDLHGVYDGITIRRLTPTECERLQGFPDGWTDGLSDTQRYKCLGNAVTTNVITAIMERLL